MDRQWKETPKVYEDPRSVRLRIYGMRNDDQMFTMLSKPVVAMLPINGQDAALKELREQFDTFLDPNCACVVGKNCELHQSLNKESKNG